MLLLPDVPTVEVRGAVDVRAVRYLQDRIGYLLWRAPGAMRLSAIVDHVAAGVRVRVECRQDGVTIAGEGVAETLRAATDFCVADLIARVAGETPRGGGRGDSATDGGATATKPDRAACRSGDARYKNGYRSAVGE